MENPLNKEQNQVLDLVKSGQDLLITGPAGSGKTTLIAAILTALVAKSHLADYKIPSRLGGGRRPGYSIAVLAWTNAAVRNIEARIRAAGVTSPSIYCQTIHNLLEFILVMRGDGTMGYEPQRTELWPLNITHLIIDEVGLLGERLWHQLEAALPSRIQQIFLADLAQLPSAFGKSILRKWLLEMPRVDLERIYRHADDNPLLEVATDVRTCRLPPITKLPATTPQGNLPEGHQTGLIQLETPLTPSTHRHETFAFLSNWLLGALRTGLYRPEKDAILIPFRTPDRLLSAYWLNAVLAGWEAYARNQPTYAVTSGDRLFFAALGDKVRYYRYPGTIVSIEPNSNWLLPLTAPKLTRHRAHANFPEAHLAPERKTLSHSIHIELEIGKDTTRHVILDEVRHIKELEFAHAMTIHKAQGQEWERVFLPWATDHSQLINNEMLYTAVTRATKSVWWLASSSLMAHAVGKQALPGITTEEKIFYLEQEKKR